MLILKIQHDSDSKPRRIKVATLPCTIGRSIESGVVLDDDLISAQHARIESREDGAFYLVDCGSTNGLFVDGARKPELRLEHQTRVRLGAVELEFLFQPELLEKTRDILLTDYASGRPPMTLRKSAQRTLLLFALYLGVHFLLSMTRYHSTPPTEVLLDILKGLANWYLPAVLLVSLFSKIITRQFRMLRILQVGLGMGVLAVAFPVLQLLVGNLDSQWLRLTISNLFLIAYYSMAAFYCLRIINSASPRRRLLVYSIGIVSILVGLRFVDRRFVRVEKYVGTLAYPLRSYSEQGRSVDDLIKTMQATAKEMQATLDHK